jgi:hypothetical protein
LFCLPADTFGDMAPNPRLRTWLAANAQHDPRCIDAEQVALFIADGGWSALGPDDAPIVAAIRIDERVGDGIVELRDDDIYYLSTGTAAREIDTHHVTVIDGVTGECMAQGWLEPAAEAEPGQVILQPFVAARPSGLSEGSLGLEDGL